METVLCQGIGRSDLNNLFNLDEIPLHFEYLSGHTDNLIAAKTISVKETERLG